MDTVLARINHFRAKHHASPLVLDDELNRMAYMLASELSATNQFRHGRTVTPRGLPVGQNIAMVFGDPSRAVDMWYAEVKDYDFKKPGFSIKTGHVTALLWKSAKQVGLGVVTNAKTKRTYVVANFFPATNVFGKYAENVFPC